MTDEWEQEMEQITPKLSAYFINKIIFPTFAHKTDKYKGDSPSLFRRIGIIYSKRERKVATSHLPSPAAVARPRSLLAEKIKC